MQCVCVCVCVCVLQQVDEAPSLDTTLHFNYSLLFYPLSIYKHVEIFALLLITTFQQIFSRHFVIKGSLYNPYLIRIHIRSIRASGNEACEG